MHKMLKNASMLVHAGFSLFHFDLVKVVQFAVSVLASLLLAV